MWCGAGYIGVSGKRARAIAAAEMMAYRAQAISVDTNPACATVHRPLVALGSITRPNGKLVLLLRNHDVGAPG